MKTNYRPMTMRILTDEIVQRLYKDGRSAIGKNEHSGHLNGKRGADLASSIERILKNYLRGAGVEHPYVTLNDGPGRSVIIRMDKPTHREFCRLYDIGYYQAMASRGWM